MVIPPSFSQPYLCTQPTLQSPPKNRSSTSINFHLPVPPLFVHKIILTIPTSIPFLCTSAIFHLPLFAYNHPAISTKNISLNQLFRQFRLCPGASGLASVLRTDTVLISSFFLQVWTVITRLIITDSLSLRYWCITGVANHPIHFLSYPQAIAITPRPY